MFKASVAEAATQRCGQKVICASCGRGSWQGEGRGLLGLVSPINSWICWLILAGQKVSSLCGCGSKNSCVGWARWVHGELLLVNFSSGKPCNASGSRVSLRLVCGEGSVSRLVTHGCAFAVKGTSRGGLGIWSGCFLDTSNWKEALRSDPNMQEGLHIPF